MKRVFLIAALPILDAARALTIDPTAELNRIDPRIYGFLLEHI